MFSDFEKEDKEAYDYYTNYNLKIKRQIYKENGLCGLINIGNKCFMNSIIQCLFHTLSFSDYLLSCDYKKDLTVKNKDRPEHFVLLSYILLINHVFDENQLIKPRTLVENICKIHKKYFSLRQQDAHEFLLLLLDIFHNSLSYTTKWTIEGTPITTHDKLVHESLQTWKTFYEKDDSFFIDTFNGMTLSKITCENCQEITNTFNPFSTTTLCLGENSSLKELLKRNFEMSSNLQDFLCEKCNKKGTCRKKTNLWKLPNYFIIHLNRFKDNLKKNNMPIDFPLENLNLTEYVSPDKMDENNYIYDCYAINCHTGNTEGGHYYSICRKLDNPWYIFDDGNVSKCNEFSSGVKDAYILFYHRKFIKPTVQE